MEKYSLNGLMAMNATFLTYFLGAWDTPLTILIAFIAIDYISGVIYAGVQKKISSEVGFKGIAKKIMILGMVSVAYYLDQLTGNSTLILRTLICYFYIANEGISILENASNLGLPIPQKLKDTLIQLKRDKEIGGVE